MLGKLIGVPILPLIAIALLIPLHLISGLIGGVSLPLVMSFYLLLGVGCTLCWSLALLFGFFGSRRSGLAGQANSLAIAFTALAFFILSPLFMAWNISVTWHPFAETQAIFSSEVQPIHWYWISMNGNAFISHSFTLTNLLIFIAIAWRILLRRFRRPLSPLFSRRQSYGMSAYLLVLAIGSTLFPAIDKRYYRPPFFGLFSDLGMGFVLVFAYLLALILMTGICPQRQALVEWERVKSSGLMGYIWSDKSPAIISFGIILIIMNALLIPWIISGSIELPEMDNGINPMLAALVMIAGGTTTVFMMGCLLQLVMSFKLRNPSVWFSGSLILWWSVPPHCFEFVRS
ncbi:MAG: hypothetical protein HC810_07660 [Acaryochloridaceae cyanobacterium RL_2_7]|nr:hypothetical protein [Acaryochloridaceae cyanobacterium RL_2_7]